MPTLATNRGAHHHYTILEEYEAGLVLAGHEVKAAKKGLVSFGTAYVTLDTDAAWLVGMHISPYQQKNTPPDYDPDRRRKLLLHHRELASLVGKRATAGLTLIPLSLYTKGTLLKVKLGLARGKKAIDKRETIKKREWDRQRRRILRRSPDPA